MTPAIPPLRYWRPLLVVVAAHAVVLALSWRMPAAPGVPGPRVLEVEVLAGAGEPAAAARASPPATGMAAKGPVRSTQAPAREPAAPPVASAPAALPATAPVPAPATASAPAGGDAPVSSATTAVSTATTAGTAVGGGGEPVIIPPRLGPGAAEPTYPPGSRWDREQGRVTLQLVVRADGRVAAVRVIRSSGFPRLDRAARETALRWRLQPARRGGEAVEGVLDKTLEFRLEN
ncbi:MAG: energy transducer TonB [Moraxellaceae bacterium]|jgi:protein TonB|nr:energy transducer TonB [Moraxellaceae bacterium]